MSAQVSQTAQVQTAAPTHSGRVFEMAVRVLLMFALCVGVAAALFYYRDSLLQLGHWGYIGAFVAELVDTAVFFLPTPAPAVVFALGSQLNPWLVGLVAGGGAVLGTTVGFLFGAASRGALEQGRFYSRFSKLTSRWGGPFLFIFTLVPFPIDLVGMWAGAARYPLWQFLLWIAPAKTIKVTAYALVGGFSFQWIAHVLGLH